MDLEDLGEFWRCVIRWQITGVLQVLNNGTGLHVHILGERDYFLLDAVPSQDLGGIPQHWAGSLSFSQAWPLAALPFSCRHSASNHLLSVPIAEP